MVEYLLSNNLYWKEKGNHQKITAVWIQGVENYLRRSPVRCPTGSHMPIMIDIPCKAKVAYFAIIVSIN